VEVVQGVEVEDFVLVVHVVDVDEDEVVDDTEQLTLSLGIVELVYV